MCTRTLFGGPLVCQEAEADENDGHAHLYASATGSWSAPGDRDGEHG